MKFELNGNDDMIDSFQNKIQRENELEKVLKSNPNAIFTESFMFKTPFRSFKSLLKALDIENEPNLLFDEKTRIKREQVIQQNTNLKSWDAFVHWAYEDYLGL